MIQVNPVTVEFEQASNSPFELIDNPNFVLGDFNGDGFIDQAKIETTSTYYPGPTETNLSILLGDENGNFTLVDDSVFAFSGYPEVKIGNFNADNHLDLIVRTSSYYSDDSQPLTLLLGEGNGEFSLESVELDLEANVNLYNLTVADINLDGLDDIWFTYYDNEEKTVIAFGDGDGFTVAEGSPFVDNGYPKVFGDFNGDGLIDKAVSETIYAYPDPSTTTLSVFLGEDDGEFEEDPVSSFELDSYPTLNVGNFNGDKNLDIAVQTNVYNSSNSSNEYNLTLLLGDGEGDFSIDTVIESEEYPNYKVADVNNDGLEDVTSTTTAYLQAVRTFLGDGNNNYEQDQSIQLESVNTLAAGDLNGDNQVDLAVATNSFNDDTGFSEDTIQIFLANEEGEFEAGETIELDESFDYVDQVSLVDLNNDGNLDLSVKDNYVYDNAIGQSIRQTAIYLGKGNGTFENSSSIIEVDNDFDSPYETGDFNGDGNFDLAIYKNSYSSYSFNPKLLIFLGTGDEGFTPGSGVEIDNPKEFAVGDVNGDGNLDLLAFTSQSDPETFITQYQLELFFGDGEGNLEPQPNLTVELDNYIYDLSVGDFDQDNNVDVSFQSSSNTVVLLGEGNGELSSPLTITPTGYGDIAIADFDGDGNLDYVNSSSYSVQTVSVLLNQTNTDITVESDETYTLQPGEKNLILIGSRNIDGIGNELDNEITGNRRRNRLEGLAGNDTLKGGDSRDTLDGGEGDDVLIGGDNRDSLIGGNGNDTLTGNESRDTFVFATDEPFNNNIGVDVITDFNPDDDSIELSQTTFSVLESEVDDEFSIPSEFAIVENATEAESSEAFIVYSQSSGELFYNENTTDSGLGGGGLFAIFENTPILSSENFTIIA